MNALTELYSAALTPAKGPKALHDPRTELRIGAAVVGLFVFGFLGWSAIARLDSAVHTPGVVKVSGSSQAVQNRAGGIVSAIHVREGDKVRAGQVLVEFATTDALAQERSLASRVFGLQAEIARINAERGNAVQVVAPADWASLNPEERDDANQALAREQSNLMAKRAMLSSERAVLRERVTQVGSQIDGYRERQKSNLRQSVLNKDELGGIQKLFNQGYATKTRVLALQRSGALIDGDIGATQAEIARLHAASGEASLQMMQLADQHEHDNTERLRVAQTELDSLLPQWKAARTQVAETQARAPVSGTVMGLAANTVGGVASPGQKLMEIVPNAGVLEVESQVALSDANDLKPGQRAEVNFSGLRGRNVPPLHGRVVRVSADSVTDERSGRSFYTAVVSVPRKELDRASREAGIGSFRPGTPVDVVVPLKARTALEYWIGPLTARFRPALTEQ
jgi:HlyD family secretion protein